MWSDLRVATRSILRRPSFSFVVALTLAAGAGANAAVFSIARVLRAE
jgi:hypothetical protein